jgi:hypothetical protein
VVAPLDPRRRDRLAELVRLREVDGFERPPMADRAALVRAPAPVLTTEPTVPTTDPTVPATVPTPEATVSTKSLSLLLAIRLLHRARREGALLLY